jgi:hypothetical protein
MPGRTVLSLVFATIVAFYATQTVLGSIHTYVTEDQVRNLVTHFPNLFGRKEELISDAGVLGILFVFFTSAWTVFNWMICVVETCLKLIRGFARIGKQMG